MQIDYDLKRVSSLNSQPVVDLRRHSHHFENRDDIITTPEWIDLDEIW